MTRATTGAATGAVNRDARRPRVTLLHTGGTAGMVRSTHGTYVPRAGALAAALETMHELNDPRLPEVQLIESQPLLDSSDVRPSDWQRYADAIGRAFANGADGVVVLHGTDTMAYSASALAFLLDGLPGPVVLTGAQIPLSEPRSDARENLIASLQLAATPGWAEVAIHFGGTLLRGCRATKVSTQGFGAFVSPDLPPLADVGVDVAWRKHLLRSPAPGPLTVHRLRDVEVVALRTFPGIGAATLRNLLREPVVGLVLETYGAGNAPGDPDLLDALREAHDRGVVIAAVTQCLHGGVRMGDYAGGLALAVAGVVPCGDMTAEAALGKLSWLLSIDGDPDRVRQALPRDARGEIGTFSSEGEPSQPPGDDR